MLGEVGSKWLDRLHQDVAKDLRSKGWSQSEIADILGSTQSTISRHIQKPTIELSSSADEAMVDAQLALWSGCLGTSINAAKYKQRMKRDDQARYVDDLLKEIEEKRALL